MTSADAALVFALFTAAGGSYRRGGGIRNKNESREEKEGEGGLSL